jgi:hypothetical protein
MRGAPMDPTLALDEHLKPEEVTRFSNILSASITSNDILDEDLPERGPVAKTFHIQSFTKVRESRA